MGLFRKIKYYDTELKNYIQLMAIHCYAMILNFKRSLKMDVRMYLFMNRIKIDQAAKKLKITPPYLSNIVNGKQVPSMKLAIQLIKFSKGEITPRDIYPELFDTYDKTLRGKEELK